MNPRTTLTMANGKGIDLLDPKVEQIDFAVICEHLSKANRYCGATRDIAYSVAEHSVRCARAAHTRDIAAYALCHDMHEAFLGDDTTPKKRALDAIAQQFGVLAGEVTRAFGQITERLDAVIHEAAGLAWPPHPDIAQAVHRIDRILLATEWRDLMRCEAPYDFEAEPLTGTINPCDPWVARLDMHATCRTLLPALRSATERKKGRG